MAKRRVQAARRAAAVHEPSDRPHTPVSGDARALPPGWVGRVPGALPVALGLGGVAFLLYLLTLAPTVPAGDSGELISAAWVLGVAHPPGYPLFTMLSHAFAWLPIGEPAWRMNLLSAVLSAATVTVVAVVIHRLVERLRTDDGTPAWTPLIAAVFGAAILAVSTAFWSYSLVAEVFALNNLLAALLLLVLLEWHRRPERTRLLWVFALLAGLAAANHHTIVLLAPAFLVLLVSGWRTLHVARVGSEARGGSPALWGLPLRDILAGVGLLLVGLVPYAYLPLAASADPPMNWQDPDTLERFLAVVTREAYGTFRLVATDARGSILEQLALLATYVLFALTPVAVLLAAGAAWWHRRRAPAVVAALLLAFLVAGPFFVVLANPPIDSGLTLGILERFYILPSIPLAILGGIGVVPVLAFLAWAAAGRWQRPVLRAVVAVLLLVPVAAGAARYESVDHSGDRVAAIYAEDLLGWLEPNALLLTRGDHNYGTLSWAQLVAGMRPDVVVLDVELLKTEPYVLDRKRRHPDLRIPFAAYDEGERTSLRDVVAANIGTRPVYSVGLMKEPDWTKGFAERRAGLAVRLLPEQETGNAAAALRADAARYAALRYPERPPSDTRWEWLMGASYAAVAFDVGFALHGEGTAEDDVLAERLYRASLRLDPRRAVTYKNLGLLLFQRDGDLREVVDLWERYLVLNPDDPQADQIEGQLRDIRAQIGLR